MIIDANRFESAPLADPEVLIVGSGPVGLTLARALDDRGMRVLILESGPRETAVPRTDTCDVLQDGTVLDSVASARTRQVGGGLNLWGGQLGLMEPSDVDYTKGWPLRYAELYRHLDEVLSMIGLRGRHVGERLKASYGPQSVDRRAIRTPFPR